jgi:cell division protein FtsL
MATPARAPARPGRAAPAAPPPRPRRTPAPPGGAQQRVRAPARPRVAGGVLWIGLVAVLLAGIVAVNVAALRLNLESQRLEERKQDLLAENATAASELSSLASAARIEAVARTSLGLVPAEETTYVRVRKRR